MPKSLSAAWRRRRFSTLLAAMAMVAFVSACDSSSGSDDSIADLAVNPPTPTLNIGSTQQLVATPTTASGKIVTATTTWSTSAASVATVDVNGLVTAVGGGSATITATAGGESADAVITVWFPVTSVAIAPAAGQLATIRQEGASQLASTIMDSQGVAAPTRQLVWTSSNPAVATVGLYGLVSARGIDGTTTITATSLVDGIVGTTVINVSGSPVVATVTLTAPVLGRYMGPGMIDNFTAVARAASGTVLNFTGRVVEWTSSAPTVATVDANGAVTMISDAGSTNIRVTVDAVESNIIAAVGREVIPATGVATPILGSIASGARKIWITSLPAGLASVQFNLSGGTGDPDLRMFTPAVVASCTGFNSGPAEQCSVATPAAGRWLIDIEAWSGAAAASGTSITVTPTP